MRDSMCGDLMMAFLFFISKRKEEKKKREKENCAITLALGQECLLVCHFGQVIWERIQQLESSS